MLNKNDGSTSFHVKDPIMINLYYDNNVDHANNDDPYDFDNMYDLVEINHELSSHFSKVLIRALSDK